MSDGEFVFRGRGGNVVGSFGSGSMVQDMPPALQFNGTNTNFETNINISSSLGTNNSTFSAWFKSLGGSSDGTILSGYVGGDPSRWDLFVDGDNTRVSFVEHATNNRIDYTFANNDTEWHHVILTNDVTANTAVLYFDGVSGGTCAVPNDLTTNGELEAGDGGGAGGFLSGSIRDVRMYDTELDVTQASALFGGTFTDQTNLLIHYDLEDPTDTTPANQGSVSANGTVSNGTWNYSEYSLNQIGAGSVSGSATVSGGTWNLRDSTSVSFDGGASHIDLSSSFTMSHNGSSLSFWVKRDNATGNIDTILGEAGDANQHWVQIKTNGEVVMRDYPKDLSTSSTIANTNWNHVVITMDGDENGAIYFNGVSQPLALNQIIGDPIFDLIGIRSTVDELDGELKDIKVYDTALTPSQVDLLFKNQWIGSPVHWWKMTEGAGSTIADSGATGGKTGTLDSTAWVNPTYDLDGRLTIAANGTVSAPKGDFDIDENFQNYGTFTHNSGTVVFTAGDNSFINTEGTVDPVFYNVTSEKNQLRFYNDVTIERQLQLDAAASHCYIWANKTLTMGSTTSPETGYPKLINNMNDGDKQFWFYAGSGQTATLQGVSELYPIIFTKAQASADIEWGYHASSAAQIKNVDFQCDIETDTSDTLDSIKLTGDCEFDKLTISNGDRINLNGQRVKFGDDFTVNSGGHNNGAGLIFAEGDYTENGTGNGYTTKTLVMDGGYCNPAQTTWKQMFLRDGTHTIGGNRDWGGTPIIIGGTSNFTSNNTWGDITIPTSGTLDGNAAVITTEGDFNMAGGIIGKSALDFNASSNPYVDLDNNAAWAFGTNNFTLEAWFRSDGGSNNRTIIANGDASDNGFLLYMQSSNNIKFYVNNIAVCNAADVSYEDSKWHHVAAVRDGNDYLLYIDGKLKDKSTQAAQNLTHSGKASIGARDLSASVDAFWDGQIGMVRVFKGATGGARTESEIRTDMFNNYADMVDKTDLFAMYQFDEATGAEVVNIQGNTNYDGTISNATWVSPGTYTYDTSTLKFDNAGTCNLTGHQDGTATQLHSIHITSGTTVAANCRVNDLVMNSGSVMTNSGTLTSNRNWQYKSRNMPIVGPNSDLKVTSNIWYYMSDGSGLPASGAGTDYYQLRPSTNVYMQGDFDCQNGLLHSGGDLHLNGYTCSTSKIWNYGGGNMHADAGSSIVFDTEYGFNVSYGENPTTMFFVASGIAGANFQGMSNSNRGKFDMHDDTNFAAVANGGPYSGSASFSYWVYLPPNVSGTLKANNVGYFGGGGGGQTGGGFCSWSYQAYNPYGGIYWDVAGEEYAQRSSNSYDWKDGDIGKLHHVVNVLDRTSGTAAGEGNLQIWVDGAMVASGNVQTSTPFTAVSSSAGFNWAIGHGNLSWPATSSTGPSMMISDFRIYKGGQDGVAGALTPENIQTLYNSGNTIIDGTGADYSDPDNALGAATWYKLDRTSAGLTSLVDSVSGSNGHYDQNYAGKTGFVTISGTTTPYNPVNNLYPAGVTLKNVYISGSKDIVAGQRKENSAGFMAVPSQIIKTEGTVILD